MFASGNPGCETVERERGQRTSWEQLVRGAGSGKKKSSRGGKNHHQDDRLAQRCLHNKKKKRVSRELRGAFKNVLGEGTAKLRKLPNKMARQKREIKTSQRHANLKTGVSVNPGSKKKKFVGFLGKVKNSEQESRTKRLAPWEPTRGNDANPTSFEKREKTVGGRERRVHQTAKKHTELAFKEKNDQPDNLWKNKQKKAGKKGGSPPASKKALQRFAGLLLSQRVSGATQERR